jgi:hypothetical protein
MKMKQIKIYAEPMLAEAFKALCAKGGTSVTAELAGYMRKRTHMKDPATVAGGHTDRRRQRKAAVRRIVSLLEKIRDAEESYLDSMPENLKGCPMAEAAGEAAERLAAAIEELSGAYGA